MERDVAVLMGPSNVKEGAPWATDSLDWNRSWAARKFPKVPLQWLGLAIAWIGKLWINLTNRLIGHYQNKRSGYYLFCVHLDIVKHCRLSLGILNLECSLVGNCFPREASDWNLWNNNIFCLRISRSSKPVQSNGIEICPGWNILPSFSTHELQTMDIVG